ncbi:MAG: S46 family peptidase [Kofleriaceae bacterium]
MKRFAVMCSLVACSGGGSSSNLGGTLGSTHDTSGIKSTAGPTVGGRSDPKLAARVAFSNPGGMWMPQQLVLPGHVETFQKLGVALAPQQLANPLDAPLAAIVHLQGCTGSFVSTEGLIVTNHHCVQNALKVNATKESNLVEKGMLAKTRDEEKSAGPAYRAYVLQAFRDVTQEMVTGLEAIKDPIARKDESERRDKQLLAQCEKDRPGIRCDVSGYFRGGQYLLMEYIEIRDVRLVYVPPRSIGNYGGEVDNWAWPRHTGDFAFMRAYVGKDGVPAAYAPDNVPFKPKHVLKVSTAGVRAADFVMIAGYPGSTQRTKTASEIRHYTEWFLPYSIAWANDRYKLVEELARGDGDTAIKAAVTKQQTQNRLENMEGQLDGLTKGDLLVRKAAIDKQVKDWAAQPGKEAYKQAIDKLEALVIEEQRGARVDFDRETAFRGSSLLSTAVGLVRWAEERTKKDADRKPGYQERDVVNATARQKQFARDYDRTLDRAGFRLALVHALKLPEGERPWLNVLVDAPKNRKVDETWIDKTLDVWYATQSIEDEALRVELLTKGTLAQLKASKDPFIKTALRIWPIVKAQEKLEDARTGDRLVLAPRYVEATREVLGGLLAPDANSTLRVTYGTVRSFKPESKDAVDRPFTVASEIPAKNTGAKEFNIPQAVLDAIKAKKYGPYADPTLGGELAVNFLTDTDTTGGNSGSPVMNGKGELVGLGFDGTKSGVASAVVFNGTTTRGIILDARYMLWVMDLIDGADNVLREMGIEPKL